MSEIKLNLIDSQSIFTDTMHASIADRCVAALSAEPETISELEAALVRFEKCPPNFSLPPYRSAPTDIDTEPYDAGIFLVDLAARIVAYESTYSHPDPDGYVEYHDGTCQTELQIPYRVPDDWLFLDSVESYEALCAERRQARGSNPPLDTRSILYGRPLLEFITANVSDALKSPLNPICSSLRPDPDPLSDSITSIHASWLLTERADLRAQSPRDVMLAKKDLIDFDLESRALQWSVLLEGPPGLSRDSFAYRYAGFGTHEWVIYYDLVRYLLWSAAKLCSSPGSAATAHCPGSNTNRKTPDSILNPLTPSSDSNSALESLIRQLDQIKLHWLTEPCAEHDDRLPFQIIDNERRRIPEAMGGRSMVIDEDCPICKMMGDESEAGREVCFMHLDGSNMDEAFAFSSARTVADWEAEQREFAELEREFQRKWQEREARRARGEPLEADPFYDHFTYERSPGHYDAEAQLNSDAGLSSKGVSWVDEDLRSFLEGLTPWPLRDPEPPEA